MILDFTIENYGPFRDPVTIDFRPTALKDPEDGIIRSSDGKHEALCSIALFGPNASGKSRILMALGVLSNMMCFPLPANVPIPFYMPFRLSPQTKGAPVRMSVRFVREDVLYDYALAFDSRTIVSESLYYSPKGERSKVFSRDRDGISTNTTPVGRSFKGIAGRVGPNSTAVSVGAQFNDEVCLKAVDEMSNVFVLAGDMNPVINETVMLMNDDPEFKELLTEAMGVADLGISGIDGSLKEKDVMDMRGKIPNQVLGLMMATGATRYNEMDLRMTHDVHVPGITDADRSFPYLIESNGTLRMLYVMGPVIWALRNGGIVAADEFGAFLDDDICRWIVQLFSGSRNTRGAQLILNTHDQLLMDTDGLFRRDQIYFVSKDRATHASSVANLSEYSIRKDFDPRKGFAQGKFGARPKILDEGWFVDGRAQEHRDKEAQDHRPGDVRGDV